MVLADSHGISRVPCYSGETRNFLTVSVWLFNQGLKKVSFKPSWPGGQLCMNGINKENHVWNDHRLLNYRTFTFYGTGFSCFVSVAALIKEYQNLKIRTVFPRPQILILWFRLFPFRSPLLRESRLLSFPSATKMFQFTELSLSCLWIQQEVQEVALFGNLRIKACFQLPEAFRRFHALHRL